MASGTIRRTDWTLLWTNSDPSTAFTANSISINLSGYSYVKFVLNYSTTSATQIICECAVGKRVTPYALTNIIGNSYVGARQRVFTTSTSGVTVDNDYYHQLNLNTYSAGSGTYMIPAEIWAR